MTINANSTKKATRFPYSVHFNQHGGSTNVLQLLYLGVLLEHFPCLAACLAGSQERTAHGLKQSNSLFEASQFARAHSKKLERLQ